MSTSITLTRKNFPEGISHLVRIDSDLAGIVDALGPPPLWSHDPGFPTLVHIVLEQQVSLASARAAFAKLSAAADGLSPDASCVLLMMSSRLWLQPAESRLLPRSGAVDHGGLARARSATQSE